MVGVAANGKYRRLIYDPTPLVLMPLAQRYESEVILHVRTRGDPMAMAAAVEQTIHSLNGDMPLYRHYNAQAKTCRWAAFLNALPLPSRVRSACWLCCWRRWGFMAWCRTPPGSGRMKSASGIALGAGKAAILRNVLQQGLILTVAGLMIGLAASFILTRFLAHHAYRCGGYRLVYVCDRGRCAVRGGGVRMLSACATGRGGGPGAGAAHRIAPRTFTQ